MILFIVLSVQTNDYLGQDVFTGQPADSHRAGDMVWSVFSSLSPCGTRALAILRDFLLLKFLSSGRTSYEIGAGGSVPE